MALDNLPVTRRIGWAQSALWFGRRLAVMPPAELAHRITNTLYNTLVPLALDVPSAVADSPFVMGHAACLFRPTIATDPHDAGRLLSGEVPIYGHWIPLRTDSRFWHTDPLTGASWPLVASGRIHYRVGNATGDVRITWELNRLQHLVSLAAIAAADPAARPRAVALFEERVTAWETANPAGMGVNWISAMECALRMVAVLHAFDLLRAWVAPPTRAVVARIAVVHARHIERHLSLYSSAGNHTIAEGVGLLYAGVLLPETRETARWQSRGRQLLAREAQRQVLPDGGGLEQSTGYLVQVRDLLALARLLLQHAGAPAEPTVDAAVDRASVFLRTLDGGTGSPPLIGDDDGGAALVPGFTPDPRPSPACGRHTFHDFGLTVIANGRGERLVFLHNPLGMAPRHGHGHADCLSVLLDVGGSPVLIDTGTGQYGGDPVFRHYFRSTRAHNTATIDNSDQAIQSGAFQWQRAYVPRVLAAREVSGGYLLVATHSGYAGRPARHVRGLFYLPERLLVVRDVVEAPADARITARWHLGCHVEPAQGQNEFALRTAAGQHLTLSLRGGTTRMVRGETDPPLGWRSEVYGQREPCDVIELNGTGPCEWVSVFRLGAVAAGAVEEALALLGTTH